MRNLLTIIALMLSFTLNARENKTNVLPITGTWLNLAYQDVRNLYTNPPGSDNTNPEMWATKVRELNEMGVEYLVFLAVANEGKSFYPSRLMPCDYPQNRKSPVDAIMDEAAKLGMKVFMSTGWAKDQDDNLRDPKIKQRQLDIMEELACLYKDHKALYGWYLPVEDCLGPVLTDYAVEAVNALTERAKQLTPDKKILISPYGIFNSDFSHPNYAKQICRLKVDIIAYQDEVGCVREDYPIVRLRENWKKLRKIHDEAGIEMWANCETFTWEKNTNDRESALIPCSYSRLLEQQIVATEGGAEKIISFMLCGIWENPDSPYKIGQPHWSNVAWKDYMDWKSSNSAYWNAMEKSLKKGDSNWIDLKSGYHEFNISKDNLFVRFLNYKKGGYILPDMVSLAVSSDGVNYTTIAVESAKAFANTRHDAFSDGFHFDTSKLSKKSAKLFSEATSIKIFFNLEGKARIILPHAE